MPARPPVANVVEIVLHGNRGANNIANVLHAAYSGGTPTTAELNTFAQAFYTALANGDGTTLWHTLLDTVTAYTSITVRDLASSMGAVGTFVDLIAGTRGGGFLPASCSMLVDCPDPLHRRAGHPRTYWPFGTDADVYTPQLWSTSFQEEVQDWYEGWTAAIAGYSTGGITFLPMGYVSYVDGGAPRTSPLFVSLGVSPAYEPDQRICSQRRRQKARS